MKKALIIFQKNAELGKVKTRLAKDVGNEKALEIYNYLTNFTHDLIQKLDVDKFLFYSDYLPENQNFPEDYHLKIQTGNDLGERMFNAFKEVKSFGYESVVIVGTDCIELTMEILETAFDKLENTDFVVGPAIDGGYYLLGSTKLDKSIFMDKTWSSNTVFSDTIKNLEENEASYFLLPILSDIDTVDDLKELKLKFEC